MTVPRERPEAGTNLFFVATPFQLVTASLVARTVGGPSRFLITTHLALSQDQIARSAGLLGVGPCESLAGACVGRSSVERMARSTTAWGRVLRLRSRLRPVDRVFVAGVSAPVARPLLFPKAETSPRLGLFDDGAATLGFLAVRRRGERTVPLRRELAPHWYSRLYPGVVRLPSVTFYTIYPGLEGADEDEVVHVPSRLSLPEGCGVRTGDELWIVGSPVVESRLVTRERLGALLQGLRRTAEKAGLRPVYFRHRAEFEEPPTDGMEVRVTSLPFELHLATQETWPTAVVAVISSAVMNTGLLFGGRTALAFVDPESECDRERLEAVYAYSRTSLHVPVMGESGIGDYLEEARLRRAGADR